MLPFACQRRNWFTRRILKPMFNNANLFRWTQRILERALPAYFFMRRLFSPQRTVAIPIYWLLNQWNSIKGHRLLGFPLEQRWLDRCVTLENFTRSVQYLEILSEQTVKLGNWGSVDIRPYNLSQKDYKRNALWMPRSNRMVFGQVNQIWRRKRTPVFGNCNCCNFWKN